MSSFWTNLLFLHGHICDPALARRLADASAPPGPPRDGGRPACAPLTALSSLYSRLCLGIGDGCVRTQ